MDDAGKDPRPTMDHASSSKGQATMDNAGKDLMTTMDTDRIRKDLWLKEREATDLAASSCSVISSTLHVLQCSIATTATQPPMWPKIKIF